MESASYQQGLLCSELHFDWLTMALCLMAEAAAVGAALECEQSSMLAFAKKMEQTS